MLSKIEREKESEKNKLEILDEQQQYKTAAKTYVRNLEICIFWTRETKITHAHTYDQIEMRTTEIDFFFEKSGWWRLFKYFSFWNFRLQIGLLKSFFRISRMCTIESISKWTEKYVSSKIIRFPSGQKMRLIFQLMAWNMEFNKKTWRFWYLIRKRMTEWAGERISNI